MEKVNKLRDSDEQHFKYGESNTINKTNAHSFALSVSMKCYRTRVACIYLLAAILLSVNV